jgi:Family of unknown function (DUF6152)
MKRILTLWALAFAPLALAHHSFAMFDPAKSVSLDGTVKEFAWTNPHALLFIDASAGPGQPVKTWTLEMSSPGNLSRQGLSRKTFAVGDRVQISISPLRSGEPGGSFRTVHFVATGKDLTLRAIQDQGQPSR